MNRRSFLKTTLMAICSPIIPHITRLFPAVSAHGIRLLITSELLDDTLIDLTEVMERNDWFVYHRREN